MHSCYCCCYCTNIHTMQTDLLPNDLMSPFLSMTLRASQHTPWKHRRLSLEECPGPVKPAHLTSITTITSLADDPCCSRNCISQLSVEQILALHQRYAACNEFERSSMIITIMGASCSSANGDMDLCLFGKPFCYVGFCRAYGFSQKKWTWCHLIFKAGGAVAINSCQGTPTSTSCLTPQKVHVSYNI